jgi:glycerophosphoryl diester phosphodiesterase
VLTAGHSDDRAIAGGDPEGAWGWLADRGFDFIQTDWLRDCADFLERTGRRNPA